MKVKSQKQIAKNLAESSVLAYLSGKKGLNWVLGEIKTSGVDKQDLQRIFSNFRTEHGGTVRFQELESKCKELSLI